MHKNISNQLAKINCDIYCLKKIQPTKQLILKHFVLKSTNNTSNSTP